MIRTLLKWTGIILGSLLSLLLVSYLLIANNIGNRTEKTYSFTAETLSVPTDQATINRGKHLAVIKGCTDCHGSNMAGKVMVDDVPLGRLAARNLTKGKGGLSAKYSAADWLVALRHGVDPNTGKPLLFMPSHETTQLAKSDMTALIAYCQQLAPVDIELPPVRRGPLLNVMSYLGKMPLFPVEMIDHTKRMVASADTTESIAQGKYLAVSCSGCHQPNLKGGDPIAPGFPPAPNITSSGDPGKWTLAQFVHTLRTGKTPEGHQMNSEHMPWKMTAQYTQTELASLYKYVRSIQ